MSFIIQPAAGGATITATASGAIAANKPCVVNANGTVSEVGLSLISGYTISGSTSTTLSTTATGNNQAACYDSVNQKVVAVYQDSSTLYLNVKVGTLSGGVMTWGTAVVPDSISAPSTGCSIVYDAASGKVVLFAYSSTFGKLAYVGTVSGTTITFGSRVVIDSNTTSGGIGAVYDSTNQKIAVFFQNATTAQAVVGTVSGTTISFGTIATFGTFLPVANTPYRAAFDASQGKIVVAIPRNPPAELYAYVATISGTSISVGSGAFVHSGNTFSWPSYDVAYDASAQRIVIGVGTNSTSSVNYAAYVATISGTSISFASGVNFINITGSETGYTLRLVYDSVAQRTVFITTKGTGLGAQTLYFNNGSISGTTITFQYATTANVAPFGADNGPYVGVVFEPIDNKTVVLSLNTSGSTAQTFIVTLTAVVSTNLTSENFIGFSSDVYSTGATATIEIVGNINDGQTSLTPGQTYYVQSAGGIGLSPSSPSVIAGTAYTSSKLIIKG